jgi:molecular chaperone GrpE (heat shock protein)
MLDFEAELNRLLSQESEPLPPDEWTELARAEQALLNKVSKKQSELGVQVEEIYDLVQETTQLRNALKAEADRAFSLAGAIVGLCDLLEDIYAYAVSGGDEEWARQMSLIWKNAGRRLEAGGIIRLGEVGQPLDPSIHTVLSAAPSKFPRECLARVLQSGYRYQGAVLRKASVVLSLGEEETTNEPYRGD